LKAGSFPDAAMELTLIETTPKATVVALSGYMGVDSMQRIEERFKKATMGLHRSAIVDLSDVSFISSFGVRLFLDVLQSLEKGGKKLFLVNPQPVVREVLVACEMDTLAGIYESKEAALAAL
jgi:anti-anti-sigma factor